jgi:hypothetical protein
VVVGTAGAVVGCDVVGFEDLIGGR